MADAFDAAAALTDAVDAGLSGSAPMDSALAGYEDWHVAATRATQELTIKTARLEAVPPDLLRFYAALRARPDAIRRLFGVFGGSIPHSAVFNRAAVEAAIRESSVPIA